MTIYLCFRRHAMSNTGTYITRDGEFSFLMGPQGSDSSPRPFLATVSLPFTSFYLDDSVVVAASEDQAKYRLEVVLDTLEYIVAEQSGAFEDFSESEEED